MLRGDAVEVKREMDNMFSGKSQLKVGVSGSDMDHVRLQLKTILVKVYGTGAGAPLDSGAVPNVLCKDFVDRLGIEPERQIGVLPRLQGRSIQWWA